MKKIIQIGIFSLLLLSIAAVGVFASSSTGEVIGDKYMGEFHQDGKFRITEQDREERQVEITEICESGEIPEDYEGRLITSFETDFDATCELHEAMSEGDMTKEEIDELIVELGLDGVSELNHKFERHERMGRNSEIRFEERENKRENHKEMMTEICETGEIPEDLEGPMFEMLNKNFDGVCEFHNTVSDGDLSMEEVEELADELGLEFPFNERHDGTKGSQRGMHRATE